MMHADTIPVQLAFDRLPSQQGWQFFANYDESRVVSLIDDILAFDSSKGSLPVAGGYRLRHALEVGAPACSVSIRARVLSASPINGTIDSYFDVAIDPPDGTACYLRLEGGEGFLGTRAGPSTKADWLFQVDASQFHDYEIVTLRGIGAYLLLDGILVASSATTIINNPNFNNLFIDIQRTVGAKPNIRAELSDFRVDYPPAAVEHPIVSCIAEQEVIYGTPTMVRAHVADPNGDALQVAWHVNGQEVAVHNIPASYSLAMWRLEQALDLPIGTNLVRVSVTDGKSGNVTSEKTVVVVDTTPPVIIHASTTPTVVWPPNHRLIPIALDLEAEDDSGTYQWGITSVTCNERCDESDIVLKSDDHGEQELSLRATRSGRSKTGRIYVIELQAWDGSGNLSEPKHVTVTVPHNWGKTQ